MVTLRDYQQEAISYFHKIKSMLLALKPGAGKTLILFNVIKFPALIVTHKYVIYEQLSQLREYYPEYKAQYIKTSKVVIQPDKQIYYVTPNMLKLRIDELCLMKWAFFCIDESHMMKNYTAKQTRAALKLSLAHQGIPKLLMSGTPAPEGLLDLYAQIHIATSGKALPDWKTFQHVYCSWRKTLWGKEMYQKKEQQKLFRNMVAPYIYTKKDIGLPKQIMHYIPLDLPPKVQKIYDRYCEDLTVFLKDTGDTYVSVNSPYHTMQELCLGYITDPEDKEIKKVFSKEKYEIAQDIVVNKETQCIVWGNYRKQIELLEETIPDSKKLYGGMSKGNDIIEEFKKGDLNTLVANPACIGAGVSLQNCRIQVFHNIPDKAVLYSQAISRTNRINQKRQEEIYILYYRGTIEEDIVGLIKKKSYFQKSLLEIIEKKFKG